MDEKQKELIKEMERLAALLYQLDVALDSIYKDTLKLVNELKELGADEMLY